MLRPLSRHLICLSLYHHLCIFCCVCLCDLALLASCLFCIDVQNAEMQWVCETDKKRKAESASPTHTSFILIRSLCPRKGLLFTRLPESLLYVTPLRLPRALSHGQQPLSRKDSANTSAHSEVCGKIIVKLRVFARSQCSAFGSQCSAQHFRRNQRGHDWQSLEQRLEHSGSKSRDGSCTKATN